MSEKEALNSTSALCGTCIKPLPANGDFVVCWHCKSNYHYSPCSSLAEATYARMAKERKMEWKCAGCRQKPRNASTSSISEVQQNQRQRESEEEEEENCGKNKRFRPDDTNSAQENTAELKKDIKEIKKILQAMNTRISNIESTDFKKEMGDTFTAINNMVEKLMLQVTEINNNNNEKDKKIAALEKKINTIAQQTLENNVEISNVPMQEGENTMTVMKNLAQTLNIQLTDNDIIDVYRQRKKNNIILKLSSRWKKEIMAKARQVKTNTADRMYFNDQLTQHNKKLLWMAKSAAKQNNWKFVWVREGKILAKKTEISTTHIIQEEKDISIVS